MYPIILSGIIFLFAGLTQGISGFGSALIAVPLLTLFMDIRIAVPLCILQGVVITLMLSLQLKQHLRWKNLYPLILGALPGVVAGTLFLNVVNETMFKISLGCLLISYSLFCFLFPSFQPHQVKRFWGYIAGFGTGAIGAAFSTGGPPVIMYTMLTGWNKEKIKATLSCFFLLAGLMVTVSHAATGLITTDVLRFFLTSLPFLISGVITGIILSRRINHRIYRLIVLILLMAMGVLLIVTAP